MTLKLIPNTKGYYADEVGNIHSPKGIVLKPSYVAGYHRVTIPDASGVLKNVLVHRLVAQAFLPNPNNLPQVNHKDGDKFNNRVDNLEWVSRSENMIHAYHTIGHHFVGSKNNRAKLDEQKVAEIVKEVSRGVDYAVLADAFGVSKGCIHNIMNGDTWNHVTGFPPTRHLERRAELKRMKIIS